MPSTSDFDPSIHLAYQKPKKIHTLSDIKLENSPISEIASTNPFPFLSAEGMRAFRRELFSKDILDNYSYKTPPRFAPFTYQFWTSPKALEIVSNLAGVDLIPVLDQEICHTNMQLGPEGLEGHRDSYPFICVVMLSDTSTMTDGETEMQKGDGSTVKVRSPETGGAVILQGRYISHIAIPAGNMPERITLVTSFRPRSPLLVDDSSLINVRTKSLLPELYYQWSHYRLRLLSERFKHEAKSLEDSYSRAVQKCDLEGRLGHCTIETIDVEALTCWMKEQMRYIR
ncbi:uncharacterized protein N7498_001622 [Penicillium cinerascens]|uniref:Fe2OG dioxygenase domain-containing protein n=1 Tax=Penicillium cinerascens TaxID=70096 RepID=A0A9W9N8H1_9EURO|nr:uncharacterized protein N7498_001622 [Penicillium cinerascens]KAJ5215215.1 hypothetical protein N7498_001622 [Penicillium cinerascens]